MPVEIRRRLDKLRAGGAECLFLHCSLKGIGVPHHEASAFLKTVQAWLGADCTLLLPSLPYGGHAEYEQYVGAAIHYDALKTPARVNLAGEMFRRLPGVIRSLNPLYPSAGVGPLAASLIEDSHLDTMPFGPSTSYRRLTARKTLVLGLGLDINTNGFIHLVDDDYVERLPVRAYSKMPVAARIFRNGVLVAERSYHCVTGELRKHVRPRLIHPLIAGASWYRHEEGDWPSYCFELDEFLYAAKELARRDLERGKLPVWHGGDGV